MYKISIVVPAHNEEGNLYNLLDELLPALEKHMETKDYEIVIVDDNSSDRTPEIIDELAAGNSRIKAVHRNSDPGFGSAVKEGFKNSTGDIIIPVMGDLSDDPEDIPKLVKKIEEGYDIAYGSRFIEGGGTEGYPATKMIANRAFNNSVRLLFGIRHKDITNAFKAYRKEVLESIGIDNLKSDGFDLTLEIPLKAHILGFKSIEIPVTWSGRKRGEAKLKLSKNSVIYGKRLIEVFILGNIISIKDLFTLVFKCSWIANIAAVIFGFIVLGGLFYFSGFSQIFEILKNVSLIFVVIAAFMGLLAHIFRAWRWHVLLQTSGFNAGKGTIFKCIMFGWFLNYLLPARIGDIARGVSLKTTENIPIGISLSTIVIERAMDMLILALMIIGTLFIFFSTSLLKLAIISMVISLLLISFLIIVLKINEVHKNKLPHRVHRISQYISTIKNGLMEIYKNPYAVFLCILLTVPIWALEISSIYFSAKAINISLSPMLATVSGITSFVAQSVPLTPAGIGIHEGSISGVLSMFDIPYSTGMAIALLDHFSRAVVIYILGIISAVHIGFQSREYIVKYKKTVEH